MSANRVATQRELEPQEFWDDLLAFIEAKNVVPVIGPELHTIFIDGREVPLYRAIAERLLQNYGLQGREASNADPNIDNQVILRPHHELHDAVSALIQRQRRVVDLYRPVNDVLRALLHDQEIPSALSELAQITDFNLFVTTTIDNLLTRAIDEARPHGGQIEPIVYALNLPITKQHDLPELWSPNYPCVFHLFGLASTPPFVAIGEEDVLEFIYSLQAGHGPRPDRMLAKLRECHLLLIGCDFADWLSRFFIRLSNQERLSSNRYTREFLVGSAAVQDQSLTLFLERYSRNTRLYHGRDAAAFISELLRRWRERRPEPAETATANIEASLSSSGPGSAFVSYAREDIAAAKQICSELEKFGAGVSWFDKLRLVPGDPWARKISAAIKSCDLFLPLLSANTEKRGEGYFRGEWEQAIERSHNISNRRFIIPVVVDQTWSRDAYDYNNVPDGFRNFQFAHAPAGKLDENLCNVMTEELRKLRRPGKT